MDGLLAMLDRSRFPSILRTSLALALLAPALGCSDIGDHAIDIVGDAAVREGISTDGFVDGWAVTFDRFVVVVHDPALIEDLEGKPAWVRELGVTVWDVAQDPSEGEAFELASRKIRASDYDAFDFYIAPPGGGYPTEAGNVEDADVDVMVDNGWSIHVVGTATDGTQTVGFDFGFDTNTLYRCSAELEIPADGEARSTIEILGDALFHNELEDPDPSHAFAAIAGADANGDGTVTLDELGGVPLTGYDAKGKDVADLQGFVTELSRAIGGVVGGTCEVIEPVVEG